MSSNIIERYLWVEKFRPKKIEDMVLPEDHRKSFEEFLRTKQIPSLMLLGIQGTGKTTIARIFIDELIQQREDVLMLNGSASTGVDVVRSMIQEFLSVPCFGNTPFKIVFVDEADYLSLNAQAALREIIEKFSDNGRFIFTANYKSKIIPPLFSRTKTFEFKKLPKDFVIKHCFHILNSEKIEYKQEFIERVISLYYPDIRRIINELQGMVQEGRITSNYDSLVSNEKKLHSYFVDACNGIEKADSKIVKSSIVNMQHLLKEIEVDYVSLYQEMFDDPNLPIFAKITINDYANKHRDCLIPALNLCSCLYQVIRTGKELVRLKEGK